MSRWTGTWMSGLGAAGADRSGEGSWPGRRYGLPPEGPGAVASTGSRFAAIVVDLFSSALIAALVNGALQDPSMATRSTVSSGVFAAQVIVLQTLTGQSLGMRLLGIRVARLADQGGVPGFLPVAIRTLLILFVLPALLMDRDGRGLHDKAAGTVVLRTRSARSFAAD